MENLDYYSHPAISNSKLSLLAKSPAHFKYMQENGFKETDALEFGKAFHCAVLEPEKFLSSYVVLPKFDKRTTLGKCGFEKFISENKGKIFIDKDQYDTILSMSKKLLASDPVNELLEGEYEKEFYWVDEETGIECKSKLDVYKKGTRVVDIKTTDCADPELFHRSIFKYGYHRQGGMYLDAAKENIPYYIIAIEKEAPYEFSILRLSEEVLELGRREFKALLDKYAMCLLQNYWPGYEAKYFDCYEVNLPSYIKI